MKNKDKGNSKDEKLRNRLTMMELDKTPERLEFESNYKCWVYATREQNEYGYNIHSVYNGHRKDEPEDFAQNVHVMKLMARYNMGECRFIWLPNEFGEITAEWMQDNKYLLDKYSHKL